MAEYDPTKPRTVIIDGNYDEDVTLMLPPERIPPEMVANAPQLSPEEIEATRSRLNQGFSERRRADSRTVDRDAHIERVAEDLAFFAPSGGGFKGLNDMYDAAKGRQPGAASDAAYAYLPDFNPRAHSADELAADYIHSSHALGEGGGPLGKRRKLSEQYWVNNMGHEVAFGPSIEDPYDAAPDTPKEWSNYENVVAGALPTDGIEETDHAYPGGAYNPQYTFSLNDPDGGLLGQYSDPAELEDQVWSDAYNEASETAGATFDARTRLERMMRQKGLNNIGIPEAGRNNEINIDSSGIYESHISQPQRSGRRNLF
jgi:hypothetical protein